MTFPQWRARLRLQHALALLAAGEPVTAVATACGFSSPSAFIETFRSTLGTTPGRYRHEALSAGSAAADGRRGSRRRKPSLADHDVPA